MADTPKIAEILEELGKTRRMANDLYIRYKQLKQIEEEYRAELLIQLHDVGLKSVKGSDFSASIAETPRVVITNETATIEWLKNKPDIEYDFYIGIKNSEFQSLAKQMLKDTGELADGTEVQYTESLAIKNNKKG